MEPVWCVSPQWWLDSSDRELQRCWKPSIWSCQTERYLFITETAPPTPPVERTYLTVLQSNMDIKYSQMSCRYSLAWMWRTDFCGSNSVHVFSTCNFSLESQQGEQVISSSVMGRSALWEFLYLDTYIASLPDIPWLSQIYLHTNTTQ